MILGKLSERLYVSLAFQKVGLNPFSKIANIKEGITEDNAKYNSCKIFAIVLMLCCQRHLLKKVIIKREYVDILTSQSRELKLRDNCALSLSRS